MAAPIRIANFSGMLGDRATAAREMIDGGPVDVLTGDFLAELTMFILAKTRAKRPDGGFARQFVAQMDDVLADCLDRGIRVVSNAGALDPHGCAEAVRRIAPDARVAVVSGDDLIGRIDALRAAGHPLAHLDTGQPLGAMAERMLTANAYLGGWGIAAALAGGADVVVTGRVTDAALTVGTAAWHHGWASDEWNALAGAVVAGHLIECGCQVTGGNYSFFTEVAGLERAGFPWVEVAEDGSCVVGKHPDTGGEVSVGTVTSQLLYEIGGHRYANPDVVTRLDRVTVEQVGPDRVRVSGAIGEPAPDTLKVAMNYTGGWKNTMMIGLTGGDVEAKAALVTSAVWAGAPHPPSAYAHVNTELVGRPATDPDDNAGAVSILRITVKDPDEAKVGRAFSSAVAETALSSIPGWFALGPPGPAAPYPVYWPTLVPAGAVTHTVTLDGTTSVIDHPAGATTPVDGDEPIPPLPPPDPAPTRAARLGTVLGTRSGDKGPNANLGVFARGEQGHRWLSAFLTVDRLRELLPELRHLPVSRHDFPALRALNFVVGGLLEEGVAASTRVDAQAKGLGEYLRSLVVEIPVPVLEEAP